MALVTAVKCSTLSILHYKIFYQTHHDITAIGCYLCSPAGAPALRTVSQITVASKSHSHLKPSSGNYFLKAIIKQ